LTDNFLIGHDLLTLFLDQSTVFVTLGFLSLADGFGSFRTKEVVSCTLVLFEYRIRADTDERRASEENNQLGVDVFED
jgi:hypothetical protein